MLALAQVARVSLDGGIFGILEELKARYDKAFLVVWDDGQGFGDDEITKEMVVAGAGRARLPRQRQGVERARAA